MWQKWHHHVQLQVSIGFFSQISCWMDTAMWKNSLPLSHWRRPPAQQGIHPLIPAEQAYDRSVSALLTQSRNGHNLLYSMGCLMETDRLSSDLPDGWGMDPYLSVFSGQDWMLVGANGQMCVDIRHSHREQCMVWSGPPISFKKNI